MSMRTFLGAARTSADNRPVHDYIVIAGQSNMDGRAPAAGFDAQYAATLSNVLVWNGTGLVGWKAGTADVTCSPDGIPAIAWDTPLLKTWADAHSGKTLRALKFTYGGTSCGKTGTDFFENKNGSWNVNVRRSLLDMLRGKIHQVRIYEDQRGYRARFRLMLWDQKESDADDLTWSQTYCYSAGNVVTGNWADTIAAIRAACGNSYLPFVYAQEMITQTFDPYRGNIIAAQELYAAHDANAYMLPMNSNTARYPLNTSDNVHYTATATMNVATDMLTIINDNHLLDGWQ